MTDIDNQVTINSISELGELTNLKKYMEREEGHIILDTGNNTVNANENAYYRNSIYIYAPLNIESLEIENKVVLKDWYIFLLDNEYINKYDINNPKYVELLIESNNIYPLINFESIQFNAQLYYLLYWMKYYEDNDINDEIWNIDINCFDCTNTDLSINNFTCNSNTYPTYDKIIKKYSYGSIINLNLQNVISFKITELEKNKDILIENNLIIK